MSHWRYTIQTLHFITPWVNPLHMVTGRQPHHLLFLQLTRATEHGIKDYNIFAFEHILTESSEATLFHFTTRRKNFYFPNTFSYYRHDRYNKSTLTRFSYLEY